MNNLFMPHARLVGVLMAIGLALSVTPPAAAQFQISWSTIDGGGGISIGGAFGLSGTIGQPDTGVMSGGAFVLAGGFWPALASSDAPLLGDMNCDGFVTVGDISGFVLALTNPAQYAINFPSCDINSADTNDDGAITVGDIAPLVALLTGG